MTAQHRLGDANTDSGYYRWWMNMLSTANTKTSNTFWTNSKVSFEQKRNVMHFRTGTLYNQKIAYRNVKASSPNCLLCQHTDSQIHMLSGCQHETMKNMITERHNIATRLIAKAISKGEYGGSIIYTDVGSDLKLTELNTQLKQLFLPGSYPISQTQNLREHQSLILYLSFQLDQTTPHMFMSKTYPLLTGTFILSNLSTVMTLGQSPSSKKLMSNTGES